ncbi:MAG: hypothetical protein ACJ71D_08380 [Nitrososphaera sp.]
MNSDSRLGRSAIKTRAKATFGMAGAIVTAAILLSGLSFIGSYPQAMAQESNMTGGMSSAGGNTTSGGAASTGGGGAATGNQSSSDVRTNLEQARMALQNNDTQSASMYIDMALSALGGSNMTGGSAGGNNMTGATSGTEGTSTTTTAGGPTAGQGEGSGGGAAGGGATSTSSQ